MYIVYILLNFILSIAGVLICSRKIKEDIIFKYGLWYFSIGLSLQILNFVNVHLLIPTITKIPDSYALINNIIIPVINKATQLLGYSAYIILVLGFYMSHKKKAQNSDK